MHFANQAGAEWQGCESVEPRLDREDVVDDLFDVWSEWEVVGFRVVDVGE